MKKSILEIYALVVCFVTIICFAVSLGVLFYDIIEMTNPEMTLRSHQYQKHQTNEAFTRSWSKDKLNTSKTEVTSMREKSYSVALDVERRDALQSSLRILIIIIINLVVFLVHWKIGNKARESIVT